MKFNKAKCIISLVVGVALCSAATLASASDLKVSNNSKYNLSFSVNNSCSSEFGVVKKRSVQIISEAHFDKACKYSPGHCEVNVYTQENCEGKQAAALIFNTTYGAQSVVVMGLNARLNGFNLFFEGPWM